MHARSHAAFVLSCRSLIFFAFSFADIRYPARHPGVPAANQHRACAPLSNGMSVFITSCFAYRGILVIHKWIPCSIVIMHYLSTLRFLPFSALFLVSSLTLLFASHDQSHSRHTCVAFFTIEVCRQDSNATNRLCASVYRPVLPLSLILSSLSLSCHRVCSGNTACGRRS